MLDHIGKFEEDPAALAGTRAGSHPADPVAFFLGSKNDENNKLRMKQLEMWYREYQNKRGYQTVIFKSTTDIAMGSVVWVSFMIYWRTDVYMTSSLKLFKFFII